jgi:hypothetical protein
MSMNELESGLNKVLEEHQHESGLHIIGGRNRLIARLTEFFEEQLASGDCHTNSVEPSPDKQRFS